MVAVNSAAVSEFLRAIRRRTWFEGLLRQLQIALWCAGVTLFLLAALRFVWGFVSIRMAMYSAIAAGFAALLPAFFRRTALSACAMRADQHFGGHSLLTTAEEITRNQESGPAASVVQSRALAAVAQWRADVNELWHAPNPGAYAVAIVPTFLAILLMASPAIPVHGTTDNSGELLLAEAPSMVGSLKDSESVVADLQEAIERDADVRPTDNAVMSSEKTDRRAVSGDGEPELRGDVRADVSPAVRQPGFAGSDTNADGKAGNARRRVSEEEGAPDVASGQYSARQDLQIRRHGRSGVDTDVSGSNFTDKASKDIPKGSEVQPAPAPPSSSNWSALTAAEVSYARTYLDATRKSDE